MLKRLWQVVSAEFLLDSRPNGGGLVLFRSVLISIELFVLTLGLLELLRPTSTLELDLIRLRSLAAEHLPWFGAIWAASYAALYARFASQWQYLAGVYNQIMSTQASSPRDDNPERQRVYANWKAGFIEDAQDLHLALKPAYAAAIRAMLSEEAVRTAFETHTYDGPARLVKLEESLTKVLGVFPPERNEAQDQHHTPIPLVSAERQPEPLVELLPPDISPHDS